MFLRAKVRKKDGKEHRYFSVVENRRVGPKQQKRMAQRTVLYLGEINDGQEAAWRKSLEVFDDSCHRYSTLSLFPEDREIPAEASSSIQVKLSEMELRRLTTATFGPTGRSSSVVNTRPSKGDVPYSEKMLAVTRTATTGSGFPPRSVFSARAAFQWVSAKNPSNERCKAAISKYSGGEKAEVSDPRLVKCWVSKATR